MQKNSDTIRKVMADRTLFLRRKSSGEMYASKSPCKYSSSHLCQMVQTGFHGMPVADILVNHSEEMEMNR